MSAPVIGKAAVVGRKLGKLVLPIVEPLNLAVDEDDVRHPPFHLIIEVAAMGIDNGHALLAGWNALMSIASPHLVPRVIERHDRVSRSVLLRDAREPA